MEIEAIVDQLTAPYYVRENLELVLGSKRRTLDYRISKLIADGVLERVKPGFYINKKLLAQSDQQAEVLEYVGATVKFPAYVSLEYALAKYGLIPEGIFTITYITTKKTGVYSCSTVTFKYRSIKPDLFFGYEQIALSRGEYGFASRYKALFDLIYLTPLESLRDVKHLLFDSRINWQALPVADKQKLVEACQRSQSAKMRQVVRLLQAEGVIPTKLRFTRQRMNFNQQLSRFFPLKVASAISREKKSRNLSGENSCLTCKSEFGGYI